MLMVNENFYRGIGRFLYKRFFKPEERPDVDLLIKEEKRYIKTPNKGLRKRIDNLAKELGGFVLRI